MDTTYKFTPQEDGRIQVTDGDGVCVAYIWNPEAAQPGLSFPRVLTVGFITEICDLVKRRRYWE